MFKWFGAALVSFCLCAAPAQAGITLYHIGGCADAPDQAICLLTLAGSVQGGAELRGDPELTARPDLLKLAGVAEAPARATVGPAPEIFLDPYLRIRTTANAVLALDRAGQPPAVALAPIRDLPADDFGERGRSMAYLMVLDETIRPASPVLRKAILADWERELRAGAGAEGTDALSASNDATALALAYVAEEDEAGMNRALDLAAEDSAPMRILFLSALGRLDRAAELVRLEQARLDAAPPDAEAGGLLEEARAALVMAAVEKGRRDIARTQADALLADPQAILRSKAFPNIAAAASPAVVDPLLDRLEQETRADQEPLRARLPAQYLAMAWFKMGRRDRFDAFVAWLKPLARDNDEVAEVLAQLLVATGRADEATPFIERHELDDLLEADIEEGRGLANLDLYLKIADKPSSQARLLLDCAKEAAGEADFTAMRSCLTRLQSLNVAPEPDAAYMALLGAAALARDDSVVAGDLATLAMTMALRAADAAESDNRHDRRPARRDRQDAASRRRPPAASRDSVRTVIMRAP